MKLKSMWYLHAKAFSLSIDMALRLWMVYSKKRTYLPDPEISQSAILDLIAVNYQWVI